MNDCLNAVIRDQLPDLLHDRLDPSARAAVMAHVESCVDCRVELDVLRSVHGVLIKQTPRVDVASIVAALPKPPIARPSETREPEGAATDVVPLRPASRRRTWADWRVAAAVVLFVAGGSSVVLLRQSPSVPAAIGLPTDITLPSVMTATAPRDSSDSASVPAKQNATSASVNTPRVLVPAETVASTVGGQAEIAVSEHLGDLDDSQLKALLDDIDHIQAVPITDPEPVAIKIESRLPARGRGRGT